MFCKGKKVWLLYLRGCSSMKLKNFLSRSQKFFETKNFLSWAKNFWVHLLAKKIFGYEIKKSFGYELDFHTSLHSSSVKIWIRPYGHVLYQTLSHLVPDPGTRGGSRQVFLETRQFETETKFWNSRQETIETVILLARQDKNFK